MIGKSLLGTYRAQHLIAKHWVQLAILTVAWASVGAFFSPVVAGGTQVPEILSFAPEEPLSSSVHATRVLLRGQIQPFGSETHWQVWYGTEPLADCEPSTLAGSTLAGSGVVEVPSGRGSLFTLEVHHLQPATHYYAILCATNGKSTSAATDFTTTPITTPEIVRFTFRNGVPESIGVTLAELEATIQTNGAPTEYDFEYATSEQALNKGEGTIIAGASGSVTKEEDFALIHIHLEGLQPETEYYVRGLATNEKGPVSQIFAFKTRPIHPTVTLFASSVGNIGATSVDIGSIGGAFVDPDTLATEWFFETATAEGGPWMRVPGAQGTIIQAEADELQHQVTSTLKGLNPATVYYVRLNAENSGGKATSFGGGPIDVIGFETGGPPKAETFAVHAVHGDAMRVFASVRPDGIDTHYHFQYVTQTQFEASGWAGALNTADEDAGSGTVHREERVAKAPLVVFDSKIVAEDLPVLQAGEAYHFRVVALNQQGSMEGREQTLVVPAASDGKVQSCSNSQLRTGLSTHLPDCRAYEQVTPQNKAGAQELFNYGVTQNGKALVGEDGERVVHEAAYTHYGSSGSGPYFFSRAADGWQLTAGTPLAEAGVNRYLPQIFDPNLTNFAFESKWTTAENSPISTSAMAEFREGPPGGPYVTMATVPRKDLSGSGDGWVASSEDFQHLFLQVADHSLCGHATGTATGTDLYEYTRGGCQQVDVRSGGEKIGSCGASIAQGFAEREGHRHAVSADGSRVFFEAVPGNNCSESPHLYVRVAKAETRDLGPVRFGAANSDGSGAILERINGGIHDLIVVNVDSGSAKTIVSSSQEVSPVVSDGFAAVYFVSHESLTAEAPNLPESEDFELVNAYRYDISRAKLTFVAETRNVSRQEPSANGRYDYFTAIGMPGLPAGVEKCAQSECLQLFRYDAAEQEVECVSCASPFAPEPELGVGNEGGVSLNETPRDGMPERSYASSDGNYAFFATPSALAPDDQNGEVPNEHASCIEGCPEHAGGSPSTDVYEWRGEGVNGCARLAGCVTLITPGTDGYLVGLLGVGAEGRDVFFTTHSQLVPGDDDSAGDIYDARIGGGFPSPPVPPTCEADTCSTSASSPIDATPSSFLFSGAGNLQPTKHRPKVRAHPKRHRCVKRGKSNRAKCLKPKIGTKARGTGRRGIHAASGGGQR